MENSFSLYVCLSPFLLSIRLSDVCVCINGRFSRIIDWNFISLGLRLTPRVSPVKHR